MAEDLLTVWKRGGQGFDDGVVVGGWSQVVCVAAGSMYVQRRHTQTWTSCRYESRSVLQG